MKTDLDIRPMKTSVNSVTEAMSGTCTYTAGFLVFAAMEYFSQMLLQYCTALHTGRLRAHHKKTIISLFPGVHRQKNGTKMSLLLKQIVKHIFLSKNWKKVGKV